MDAAKALGCLDKALQRAGDGSTREDVLGQLLSGEATVIHAGGAFAVCKLYQGEKLTAHAWIVGGDLKAVMGPLKQQAEHWARLNGAELATISGGPGWARLCRDYEGQGDLEKVL